MHIDRAPKYVRKTAFDLSLVLMLSGFAGGRLLHVFYEEWLYYLTYPQEIIKFWKGGFVYYGGWLTCLIFGFLFLRSRKLKFLPWADFFTPLLSLGYALGRVACYFEGCCYGTTMIPLQLIMVFCELALLSAVLFIEKKHLFKKSGSLFLFWAFFHATTRFFIEFYRADERGRMIFEVFSVSQVISLGLIFAVVLHLASIKIIGRFKL